jgi:hypothetical protein
LEGSVRITALLLFVGLVVFAGAGVQSERANVSFSADVFPIIKNRCLPCHAEESFNPSELSLDSYELLMAGGKHGPVVVPGKSKESNLVKKLSTDPPFGDRMPLDLKKKKGKASTGKPLTDEEIRTIATWIDQGAKDN